MYFSVVPRSSGPGLLGYLEPRERKKMIIGCSTEIVPRYLTTRCKMCSEPDRDFALRNTPANKYVEEVDINWDFISQLGLLQRLCPSANRLS